MQASRPLSVHQDTVCPSINTYFMLMVWNRDAESLLFVGLRLLLCDIMIVYLRTTWEKFQIILIKGAQSRTNSVLVVKWTAQKSDTLQQNYT